MKSWPLLATKGWPYEEFPASVEEYFVETKVLEQNEEFAPYFDRDCLLALLSTNAEFSNWWSEMQALYPENVNYFESLLDEDEEFDGHWIMTQYQIYQQQLAFIRLSEEEKILVSIQYSDLTAAKYQDVLQGEAWRLGCDVSNARPVWSVPLLKPEEEESKLADLPANVFVNIVQYVDTLDIFRMTLVCKRWKYFLQEHKDNLKRAEHAITTHLLAFTEWMDPSWKMDIVHFGSDYANFEWNLLKWYCQFSENVEVLILDTPGFFPNATELLNLCPKLKHLQLADPTPIYGYAEGNEALLRDGSFPKLESLLFGRYLTPELWTVAVNALVNGENLKVFRGPLDAAMWLEMKTKYLEGNIFANLIALQLTSVSVEVLKNLADLDGYQLRYFTIDNMTESSMYENNFIFKESDREHFNKLLTKMPNLEHLGTYIPGIDTTTIITLSEMQLCLKSAVFWQADAFANNHDDDHDDDGNSELGSMGIDAFAVILFRDMLLDMDPSICLRNFVFYVTEEIKEELDQAAIGFTIKEARVLGNDVPPLHDLNFPPMRRHLNLPS